jgi:propionyl-CoA carboxylase beta chain
MDLAAKTGAPVIGLNDSGGARIQEGVLSLAGYADIFLRNTLSAACAADLRHHGPLRRRRRLLARHHRFHLHGRPPSYMFVTGPDVIKTVTHEDVTKDELGGAMTHNSVSGVAHFMARDDAECLRMIRELLSFPASEQSRRPAAPPHQRPHRPHRPGRSTRWSPPNPTALRHQGRHPRVVDDGDFFEVHEHYAKNIVVGFARSTGAAVGIVANQPAFLAGRASISTRR